MRARGWLVSVAAAALATVGVAGPAAADPSYPAAQGRCVDQVGVLGDALCAKVTAVLLADERKTTDEIAVAVVPTTGDATIEAYSTGLFNSWGVGKKDKNNGVLLVVAVDDHRVRLETGRGMAGRLSDHDAAGVIGDVITPRFKTDAYALGILAGLDEVRRAIGHRVPSAARLETLAAQAPAWPSARTGTADTESNGVSAEAVGNVDGLTDGESVPDDDGSLPILPMALVAVVLVGLIAILRGSSSGGSGRRGRYGRWSSYDSTNGYRSSDSSTSSFMSSGGSDSSSGGSSGSSFGGGDSSGGGASGSW